MKKLILIAAVMAALAETASAAPVQLISNGDFETGNLSGWTVNRTGDIDNDEYVIVNGGVVPASGHPTQVLSGGGNFVVASDQTGAGGEELRQAFTVAPGTVKLTLDFDWFDNTHNPYIGAAIDGSEQAGRVDLLVAGAGRFDIGAGVVQNLLLNAGTETSFGVTIPWQHATFDLTGLAVGGYELRFGNGQCCFFQEMGIDNVSLLAQIPEPGSIALIGAALASFGASRRRQSV